jgi:hypothetical protein
MEHRWGERIKVDLPVEIAGKPEALRAARIDNLSLSGASIRADFELRPLSRVQVILSIPTTPRGEPTSITAYVTRSNKNGIGVEWCEYAPPVVNELMQMLGKNRGNRLRTAERPNRRLEALFLKPDR